jgi:hypothetical protein
MTLIAHHHIFKNAGTTIDWILERNFPSRVLHIEGVDPGARLSPEQVRAAASPYPEHSAIASHSFPLPAPETAWALVHLSVLRDPIERYASIYRFERSRETPHAANEAARTLGLGAFCQWWLDNRPGIWVNWQTRCCTPQARVDDDKAGSRPSGWDADIDLALQAVLQTAFVFTLDRFDQGLVLLEERMEANGMPFDASYLRQNVSRADADQEADYDALLGRDLHQALVEANQLDYMLIERVRDAIDQRYARLDPRGARLSDFRGRCARLADPANRPVVRVPGQSDWILAET